jgi:rubrerythrin
MLAVCFFMTELNDFYNEGFGWICRHCERELERDDDQESVSRLMTEGEAESKTPELSNRALAQWADAAQTVLVCPRCGITEETSKY